MADEIVHRAAGRGVEDAEIKRAITEGISRDGRALLPFMPYWLYKKMEPSDLDAIVAYLRSLPHRGEGELIPLGDASFSAAALPASSKKVCSCVRLR